MPESPSASATPDPATTGRPLRLDEAAPDVVVVGAGAIGLAVARELAGRGLAVEVFDRSEAGSEASGASAGMLAPLAEVPEAGPLFTACREARDLWPGWVEELSLEAELRVEHDSSGALMVALPDAGEEGVAALERLRRAARALGEAAETISPEMLRDWVPHLPAAIGPGLHLPGDHRVDNTELVAALLVAAERRGVTISTDRPVTRIARHGSGVRVEGRDFVRDAGALVVAAGAWSGSIEGLPELPVFPVRGQMLRLAGVEWPWSGIVRHGGLYTVRRGESGLLVGATVEDAGFSQQATVGGIGALLDGLRRLLPGLAEAAVADVWAGLRPGSADDLPVLGPLPGFPAAIAATGHYRNGILLTPWTAREIADTIDSGNVSDRLAPFSPGRFNPY